MADVNKHSGGRSPDGQSPTGKDNSWVEEYAKSHGWNDWEISKKISDLHFGSPTTIKKFKRLDTSLQKEHRHCRKEMENERIKTGADFVRWMSNKFDPNDEKHKILAQEISSCLWLSHHLE